MTALASQRFLVTGAAGFLGSHLCESLLADGAKVIGVDNFITGSRDNLKILLRNGSFEFIERDVIEPLGVRGALAGIFHLASPASPIDYANHPIETLRTGSLGSDRLLELARENRCRILVASTSEVYGDPLQHPQTESYWGNVNPIGPRGCYDESKRYMEALTMAYHRVHGVETRIVRIFNTYGPRMRMNDGRVVPNFFSQALSGTPVTVYGTGNQTRSFCYVSDLVGGMRLAFEKGDSKPVNLGNPMELPVLEFAKRILAITQSKSTIVFRELPEDDPKVRCPDISRAQSLLNWSPQVSLEDGLTLTMRYFEQLKKQ